MTRAEKMLAAADVLDQICADADVALYGVPNYERTLSRTILRFQAIGDARGRATPLEELLARAFA